MADDRARGSSVMLLTGIAMLVAWSCWLLFSKLPVYVTSAEARIEIDRAAHPIQSPLSGRIVVVTMRLGMEVQAGDALVELDTEPQRLEVAQGRARISALVPEIEAARQQLAAEELAMTTQRQGAGVTLAEAQARVREAEAAHKEASDNLERTNRLAAEGLASKADTTRANGEQQQRAAARDALKFASRRIAAAKRLDVSDRQVLAKALERQIVALEGEIRTVQATVERLEHEVNRRVLRAPVDGLLVEMTPITSGAVVKEGERIGVILPPGRLRAIAELAPPDALGRVRVDQRARLRLEGFPWAQHGTVAATVTRVSGEVRENRVRVELSVDASASAIPLQHGLPGVVEIEVERTSPAVLILRAAGRTLDRPRPKAEPPKQPVAARGPA